MKKKHKHITKTTGFKIPKDYFDDLESNIINKLNNGIVLDTIKSTGFQTPETYFESLENQILSKVNSGKPVKKILPLWKKATYITGIAASVTLIISLVFANHKPATFEDITLKDIEYYLTENDLTSNELATLFNDATSITNHSYISEEALEDFILNNTSIDDLIILNP